MRAPGHDALWDWFGLSYAGWLTIPRVVLHAMPDEWQGRLAALLNEYDDAVNMDHPFTELEFIVTVKRDGKFIRMPDALSNYRHPDMDEIGKLIHPKQRS